MAAMAPATRLFVGGLGERVTEEDLRKTFSSLGSIEAVDIIRTKGRSFAYINFLPSSDNSLAKLFSMYNGCSWKGGKLKLEKAKEHYVDRLKREWAEDVEVESSVNIDQTDGDGTTVAAAEAKSTLDLEKGQIHIFFPKLRKIKSLPLRGTGKHKYSFQRVEVPPLPVHTCDCCLKDSGPVQTPRDKFQNAPIQDAGINEEEISVMNSVMSRLLNRETCSKSEHSRLPKENEVKDSEIQDGGISEEEINLMDSVMKKLFNRGSSSKNKQKDSRDNPQKSNPSSDITVGTNEVDDETDDDDDIKINLASAQDDDLFPESWGLQTNEVIETARSNEELPFDGLPTQRKQRIEEKKLKSSNKKRKTPSDEGNENDVTSPKPKKKARVLAQSNKSEVLVENPNGIAKPGTEKSSRKDMWSQKSVWKQLVGDGASSSFSISHVTPGIISNDEETFNSRIGDEKSSENKEHITVRDALHEKMDEQSSLPKDRDEEAGIGEEKSSDIGKHITVHDASHEKMDETSSLPKDRDESPTLKPSKESTSSDKSTKGSSWLQKSSWTQLVSGASSSSFSISQIVPVNMVEKQDSQKPNIFGSTFKGPKASGSSLDGSRSSKPGSVAFNKQKNASAHASSLRDAKPSKDLSDDRLSDKDTKKTPILQPKPASKSLPGIGLGVRISETCPFMRDS